MIMNQSSENMEIIIVIKNHMKEIIYIYIFIDDLYTIDRIMISLNILQNSNRI